MSYAFLGRLMCGRSRLSGPRRALKLGLSCELLEDRCLLAILTAPEALTPVAEMVYGPVGDIWFSRVGDAIITRIASDGSFAEFGLLGAATIGTPINLETDANDDLWFQWANAPPNNHLFRMTPTGDLTEISDFLTYFRSVSQDAVPPFGFLTHGHINPDNMGELIGIKADGSAGFYILPNLNADGKTSDYPGFLPDEPYDGRPLSITVQPDTLYNDVLYSTAFWYTDGNGIAKLGYPGEYDRFPLPDPDDRADSIAYGPDGNIWVVENYAYFSPTGDAYYLADKIAKVALDGTFTEYDVKLDGFRIKIGPLVTASNGTLEFDQIGVEENGVIPEPNTHRIGRINADGTISRFIPPDPSAGATAYASWAVGPTGAVADSPSFLTDGATHSSIVDVHTFSELTSVSSPNVAPVAVNDGATCPAGGTLNVPRPGVLGNDTDANSDALRAILVSGPSHGTLTLNANGSYTYTANAGFDGTDTFTYRASDGLLQSSVATVSITTGGGQDPPPPEQLGAFANALTHSAEHYTQFVTKAYQSYLGRPADQGGLNFWVGRMQTGLTDEQLEAGFIGSSEYIAKHGGTGPAWVQGLYHDILGRVPGAPEVTLWVNQLDSHASPQAVAYGFTASRERESNRVRSDYQTFLGRTPAQAEVDLWVNGFVAGVSNEDVVAGFLGSDEYYNNALKGQGNNLAWIKSAILDEFGRPAAASEISQALATLAPTNLAAVITGITHSAEHYQQFVTNAYQSYLGRTPDAGGLAFWVGQMQAGLSDEQIEASFIGSAEYIANHGGAGAGWVRGLYHDILARTPGDAEVTLWVNQLNAGALPQSVAYGFTASQEREGNRIRTEYQSLLGRTPSQGETDGWVSRFLAGASNEDILTGFLGSVEYFNSAAKGKSSKADWISSAFLDYLGRNPSSTEFDHLLNALR